MRWSSPLLVALACAGCSSEGGTFGAGDGAGADASALDGGAAVKDAELADGASDAGASGFDAGSTTFDAGPGRDAGPAPELTLAGSRVRFATRDEASALLGTEDDFVRHLSDFDRSVRARTATTVGVPELLAHLAAQGLDFTTAEKNVWTRAVRTVDSGLGGLALGLPPEILLVKTTGREDVDTFYTRQNAIVIPQRFTNLPVRDAVDELAHELFHVVSRAHPERRDALYALLGFVPCPPVTPPPELEPHRFTNPDAFSYAHALTVHGAFGALDVVPELVLPLDLADAITRTTLLDQLGVKLIAVDLVSGAVLRDEAGQLRYLDPRDTDWEAQLAINTDYTIHPEEALADNFRILISRRRTTLPIVVHPELLDALEALLQTPP